MNPARALERSPAIGLVGVGAVSVQFGAAFATKLFGRVGPAGAVTLRLVVAAVVLIGATRLAAGLAARAARAARAANSMAVSEPGSPSAAQPDECRVADERAGYPQNTQETAPLVGKSTLVAGVEADRAVGADRAIRARRAVGADRAVVLAFGLVLGAMNLSFYEAIARIPLGVAVTLEFTGPLALALVGSRHWADGLWAAGAGTGVALLASGVGQRLDPAGVAFALIAGACWVAYILLSKETGRRYESLGGLAGAMSVGALAVLPFGLHAGGVRLLHPAVLGLGVAVGVMSSVVPYSLELLALRRVTPRAFGVMMSLDPALAATAGFAVLGQHLDLREWIALALVIGANLGNAVGGLERSPPGDYRNVVAAKHSPAATARARPS